jgi:hypothetical protein
VCPSANASFANGKTQDQSIEATSVFSKQLNLQNPVGKKISLLNVFLREGGWGRKKEQMLSSEAQS